jgi:hypothetical protein
MSIYTPPPKNNIPFTFTSGGYQPPQFNDVAFNFKTKSSQISSLSASISVMQRYQESTYTFLKYCEQYIIGYGSHGVQIIKGKCHYGGISIGGHTPKNLPVFIRRVTSTFKDLFVELIGLVSTRIQNLTGFIAAHAPIDLSGSIHGFEIRNLSGVLNIMLFKDLLTTLTPIQPKDLTAYLKVWPETNLTANLHSWQESDLSAYINITFSRDLTAFITTHTSVNLRSSLKGQVIEAIYDLSANVFSYALTDLQAIIKGSEFSDLTGYLFPVVPKNLQGWIRGWQAADITANIISTAWPWDLTASITGSGSLYNLTANIRAVTSQGLYRDLSAYILTTKGVQNLQASILSLHFNNLSAFICQPLLAYLVFIQILEI